MIEQGRLIVKLAGRDAGLKGVIVEILDDNYVLIDGQVRRKKCNILHVEPLDKVLKIPKKATHSEIVAALKAEKIEVKEIKSKSKTERPRKVRKSSGKSKISGTTESGKKKVEVVEEVKEKKPKVEKKEVK